MNLLPFEDSFLVLPYTPDEAEHMLMCVTKPIESINNPELKKMDAIYKFNGDVEEGNFRVSKKVKYVQNFIPLIKGNFDRTSNGCIVMLKFRLFFGTLFMMALWSIGTLAISIIFVTVTKNYLVAGISFSLFALNYIIAILNFNMHVRDSKKLLEETFSL